MPEAVCCSAEAIRIRESHGDICHRLDRCQEVQAEKLQPSKKARGRAVEVCGRWFNRFRKQLVHYEGLERRFLALNLLAVATIALQKVPQIL